MPLEYLDNLREHDFNPWWGCTKVSPACDRCYAENVARMRGGHQVWGKDAERRFMSNEHFLKLHKWNKEAEERGRRINIFCGSMCDIMEDRPDLELDQYREYVWWFVERTRWLNWMFFTKRPQNYRKKLPKAWLKDPRDNVWIITTVEQQDYMWRLKEVMKLDAVIKGVICEPLLSEIVLPKEFLKLGGAGWVMTGTERGGGRNSRPTQLEWVRKLRDQATDNGVPFFFNQWGEYGPNKDNDTVFIGHNSDNRRVVDGAVWNEVPSSVWIQGLEVPA